MSMPPDQEVFVKNVQIEVGNGIDVLGISGKSFGGKLVTINNVTIKTGLASSVNRGMDIDDEGPFSINNTTFEIGSALENCYGIQINEVGGNNVINNVTIITGPTTNDNNYGIFASTQNIENTEQTIKGNTSITSGDAYTASTYGIYSELGSSNETTTLNFGSEADNLGVLDIRCGTGAAGSYGIYGPYKINVYQKTNVYGDCAGIGNLNLISGPFSLNSTHTVASGETVTFNLNTVLQAPYILGDSSTINFQSGSNLVINGGESNSIYHLFQTNSSGETKVSSWETATLTSNFSSSDFILDEFGLWLIPQGNYSKSYGIQESLNEVVHSSQIVSNNLTERICCRAGPYIEVLGAVTEQDPLSSGYGYNNDMYGIMLGYNHCICTCRADHKIGIGYTFLNETMKFKGKNISPYKRDKLRQYHHILGIYGSQNRPICNNQLNLNYIALGGYSHYKKFRTDTAEDNFEETYDGALAHANLEGS